MVIFKTYSALNAKMIKNQGGCSVDKSLTDLFKEVSSNFFLVSIKNRKEDPLGVGPLGLFAIFQISQHCAKRGTMHACCEVKLKNCPAKKNTFQVSEVHL